MSDATNASRSVDAAVAQVSGVVEQYAARPLVARVWRRVVDAPESYSAVAEQSDPPSIVVSVGITDGEPAAGVAARVSDAARTALGDPRAQVTVRISRVIRRAEE